MRPLAEPVISERLVVRERTIDPMLLSVAVVWGLNPVANKWVLEAMGPAGVLAFRYVGCTVVLLWAAWRINGRAAFHASTPPLTMWIVGALVGAQQLMYIYALDWTTASEGALLISVAPIWTALAGAALGMERIGGANWLGIFAAAGGVALLVMGGHNAGPEASHPLAGNLLMLLSSLLYGGGMVYLKRVMDQYEPVRVMAWAFVFGSVMVIPAGYGQLVGADWPQFNATLWGAMLYSAFLSGGWGMVVWYQTIARTTAARTAVYQYLVPVVALVGSWALLGDRLLPLQLLGAAIVIPGLILARRPVFAGPSD